MEYASLMLVAGSAVIGLAGAFQARLDDGFDRHGGPGTGAPEFVWLHTSFERRRRADARSYLTIRPGGRLPLMGWSGRAPAPPATNLARGAKDKEHPHVPWAMLQQIGLTQFNLVTHDRGTVQADFIAAKYPSAVLRYGRGKQHLYHFNPAGCDSIKEIARRQGQRCF